MIQWILAIWSLVFSLYIWKFSIHILLKLSLKNFEHYLVSRWNEHSCIVVWAFFGIAFLWDLNEDWLFQSCGHGWIFQICWYIECNTFSALSFRIWNSSTGILSPPFALFIVMLPKVHLTSHSRMSGLLLGRKAMTNLDSILKSRDITLPTKVHLVKVMVFPVVMYGCESWTKRKLNVKELMLLNCGVGEDSLESLGLQEDQTSQS